MVVLQFGKYPKMHHTILMNLIMKAKVIKLQDKLQSGTNVTKTNQFGIYN